MNVCILFLEGKIVIVFYFSVKKDHQNYVPANFL